MSYGACILLGMASGLVISVWILYRVYQHTK